MSVGDQIYYAQCNLRAETVRVQNVSLAGARLLDQQSIQVISVH